MFSFADIERTAQTQAMAVLSLVLPHGKLNGAEYQALNPTRVDSRLGSFAYNIRKHAWADFATGDKGKGLIALYAYLTGKRYSEAARDVAGHLGMVDDSVWGVQSKFPNPVFFRSAPSKVSKPSKVDGLARQLWRHSQTAAGTPVEAYLASRGLTAIPPTIRYLSRCKHTETGTYHPAMLSVAAVWPHRKVMAVHRTYLRPDGTGKADIEPNKKMLGAVTGGAVWLAPPRKTLIVGEGIETCLSAQQATMLPVWAALSTSGLINLILPDLPLAETVLIAADNDANGAGMSAAQKAAKRWMQEGRKVRIVLPDTANDFNDLLRTP